MLSRLWAGLIIRTCGIKVEIEGLENLRGLKSYVLVANHQSFFDIFAVVGVPARRHALRREKGTAADPGGRLCDGAQRPHHRRSPRRRPLDPPRAGSRAQHYPICVFAEGHRHNDGRVHEFSEGAAWLAIMAKLPCVPMAISGSGAFFPREAKVPVPGGRMKMTVLPPIPTDNLTSENRTELTKELEAAVRAAFIPEL